MSQSEPSAPFTWGAATSAYQVEGSTTSDGRVASIWDTFTEIPGAIVDSSTGALAADHYRRYDDDLALAQELGINAYRFSVPWPRIAPGPGRTNRAGIDYLERLVDSCLAHGLTPWATLYHWDLPQWAQDRGGWANRETAHRFAELTDTVADALSDRVDNWITINEPWVAAFAGYAGGQHAPGLMDPQAGLDAAHHLLLAHGLSLQVLREATSGRVGITLSTEVLAPADPGSPADLEAAHRLGMVMESIFLDPVFRGAYPQELLGIYAQRGLSIPAHDGDLEIIGAPIDFLGLNYYSDGIVSATPPLPEQRPVSIAEPSRATRNGCIGAEDVHRISRGFPTTAMGWEVNPEGLHTLLTKVSEAYTRPAGIPVVITENGAAYDDAVSSDGRIHDDARASYLGEHIAAMQRAREDGVDVSGYFVWSLLDNFEWAYGYTKKFGIVAVSESGTRIVKDSARRYRDIIATYTR